MMSFQQMALYAAQPTGLYGQPPMNMPPPLYGAPPPMPPRFNQQPNTSRPPPQQHRTSQQSNLEGVPQNIYKDGGGYQAFWDRR
jgi:hypothetical protein